MSAEEPQEGAEWWHKPLTGDTARDNFANMISIAREGVYQVPANTATDMSTIVLSGASPLTLQIRQLERTVEALEKRIEALEQHNALTIEELEAELARRYKRATGRMGVHVGF